MPSENYRRIYAVVRKIPRGKVATYGQIAALAGIPRGARQVGYALRMTPENVKLPWHRVVNTQGSISLRLCHWESGSDELQRILLEEEGMVFDSCNKIDLKRFQWRPRGTYSEAAYSMPHSKGERARVNKATR